MGKKERRAKEDTGASAWAGACWGHSQDWGWQQVKQVWVGLSSKAGLERSPNHEQPLGASACGCVIPIILPSTAFVTFDCIKHSTGKMTFI